ncbi:MAG: HAD family hydrolase [Alphaproteobacteria bacterium]|nr:HAD family hydrolase [Alphaproteobacteria bacterium]
MTEVTEITFPKAIIFDWDSTLVDTWPVITEALNKVRAIHGLETWTIEEARVKSARALRVSFPEWFGDWWETARDIFYQHIDENHIKLLKEMPGAGQILAYLNSRKIPLFIVSTKKNTLLGEEIKAMEWQKYFIAAVGSLDTPKDKPDRMPVDLALCKGGLKADDPAIWFVGDSHTDIACARNSGTTPVLIGDEATALKYNVKIYFKDCNTMETALKGWNCYKSTLG